MYANMADDLGKSLFVLVFTIWIVSMAINAWWTGKFELDKEQNIRIELASEKANQARDNVFCEEYRKIVERATNAPPAYKHCFGDN